LRPVGKQLSSGLTGVKAEIQTGKEHNDCNKQGKQERFSDFDGNKASPAPAINDVLPVSAKAEFIGQRVMIKMAGIKSRSPAL
jgi:hypothetical protein